jgi:hypothetical protein
MLASFAGPIDCPSFFLFADVTAEAVWATGIGRSYWPLLSDKDTSGRTLIGFTSVFRFGFMAAFLTGPYPHKSLNVRQFTIGFQLDVPGETCWTSHAFHTGLSSQTEMTPEGMQCSGHCGSDPFRWHCGVSKCGPAWTQTPG